MPPISANQCSATAEPREQLASIKMHCFEFLNAKVIKVFRFCLCRFSQRLNKLPDDSLGELMIDTKAANVNKRTQRPQSKLTFSITRFFIRDKRFISFLRMLYCFTEAFLTDVGLFHELKRSSRQHGILRIGFL